MTENLLLYLYKILLIHLFTNCEIFLCFSVFRLSYVLLTKLFELLINKINMGIYYYLFSKYRQFGNYNLHENLVKIQIFHLMCKAFHQALNNGVSTKISNSVNYLMSDKVTKTDV